jgi:hypothetical protein
LKWQNNVGSVVVMRKDKKLLLPEHVTVLAEYCQFHHADLFQQQMEGNMSKGDVLKHVTQDKFVVYCEAWKAQQSRRRGKTRYLPPTSRPERKGYGLRYVFCVSG